MDELTGIEKLLLDQNKLFERELEKLRDERERKKANTNQWRA